MHLPLEGLSIPLRVMLIDGRVEDTDGLANAAVGNQLVQESCSGPACVACSEHGHLWCGGSSALHLLHS